MAHPEFTVLLARQRSGTNALRSVLSTHPDICCFDEVFKLSDRHSDDPSSHRAQKPATTDAAAREVILSFTVAGHRILSCEELKSSSSAEGPEADLHSNPSLERCKGQLKG